MKKILFLLCLCFAIACNKDDSIVHPTNLNISSQQDVDNFNFTVVEGPLFIYGRDITNLNNLSSLEEVGSIYIRNTSLQNLNGLHNVNIASREDFTISIDANPLLEDVSALSGISDKTTALFVRKSPVLASLDGLGFKDEGQSIFLDSLIISNVNVLNNVRVLSDNIELSRMPKLTSIQGLANFQSGSSIILKELPNINNLDSFENLNSVLGSIHIVDSNVSNIDGLSNVTELDGIFFQNLPNLENLDGLINVFEMSKISLNDLPNLEQINGLSNLNTIGKWFGMSELPNLTNLDAFINVVSLNTEGVPGPITFTIRNCVQITNLNGFSNMIANPHRGGYLRIQGNAALSDFCGLQNYVLTCECTYFSMIHTNAYNPTIAQIASETECSQ